MKFNFYLLILFSDVFGDKSKDNATRMKIGPVIVELQKGDITKEKTDAIVNSVGHDLGLRGRY